MAERNLPLESTRSRKTREAVNAATKVSATTGDDASAFFPAAGDKYPVGGGDYRAADKAGALEGTTDGLNGVTDARQGLAAASVPDYVKSTTDKDADGVNTPTDPDDNDPNVTA